MILSFRHKGLEVFYKTGSMRGIQTAHAAKLTRILQMLDVVTEPRGMVLPGFGLHPLKGRHKSDWSVCVSGNWRVTFRFVGQDVELVNYENYH